VARDGSVGYYSHIIVHKDSPFAKVEDMLQQDNLGTFGIGDPNSKRPASWCPPRISSPARNIDPKTCFRTLRNANHQANAMAVANKQVAAATNNSEDLQRVAAAAPDARSQIKIIWTSPLIPLDPLVWRKDLDPAVKTKLYTFLMSYGRIGSDEEIKGAKAVLANLIWSPFHPSSDNQLIPIRILEANKSLMKVQGDEKLSQEEKSREIAAIRAEISMLEEREKKAEADGFQRRAAAFVEADKAGRQDELKKMIAEFAAGSPGTH
jgi:phosphonate transport system substrate-binding protein